MNIKNKTLIIQNCLQHYRVPFYDKLRLGLSKQGIQLDLIYGDGDASSRKRGGMASLPWGTPVKNHIIKIFGIELLWQPALKYIKDYDLIIVGQENKFLLNYILFIFQIFGGPRIAMWGHGITARACNLSLIRNFVKKTYSRLPFWWFAYTKKSKDTVSSFGYPPEKITVVENSIDTQSLREASLAITDTEKRSILDKYGLIGENTCIYCGSLYKEKNLSFLIDACDILANKVRNFELIIIGSGEERPFVEEKARQYSWIKYFGDRYDREKAELFNCSKLLLMPGAVGLAILDSFVFGKPIVTTDNPYNGPEIVYLDNGNNGMMTSYDATEYTSAIIKLLEDSALYAKIQKGALGSGQRYSIDRMVNNFVTGVEKILAIAQGLKTTYRWI